MSPPAPQDLSWPEAAREALDEKVKPVGALGRLEEVARSTVYFPVVGVLVGGIGAGVFWGVHLLWPSLVAIIAALAAVAWSTGAFHEDGLADTVDGFGGGWRARTCSRS